MYKVSVIIPIYNSGKFLSECLQSIADQTLDMIQVIMVDDGSMDNSGQICQTFVDKYSGFEYYHKENGGTASARNMGLEHAVGEYIGFVDSDDTIEPNMFEVMYSNAIESDADILYCIMPGLTDYVKLQNGVYTEEQLKDVIYPAILPHVVESGTFRTVDWGNWSRLFRGSLIRDNSIKFYDKSRRCEDFAFAVECTLHAKRYMVIDEGELYHYRPNENSKSRSYTKNMWKSISKLMKYMQKITSECTDYDFTDAMDMCIFYFCTQVIRNEMRSKKHQAQRIQKVLDDPLCKISLNNITPQGMNQEYTAFVHIMKKGKAGEMVKYLNQLAFKKKYIMPIMDAAFKNAFIKKVYVTLRGKG